MPPPCREMTESEKLENMRYTKGKLATWNERNNFICARDIFEPGEWDNFEEFFALNAEELLDTLVLNLKRMQQIQSKSLTKIYVKIISQDQRINHKANSFLLFALKEFLPEIRILRMQVELDKEQELDQFVGNLENDASLLVLKVQRSQIKDYLFEAVLYEKDLSGIKDSFEKIAGRQRNYQMTRIL